jgi:hypothetical protein
MLVSFLVLVWLMTPITRGRCCRHLAHGTFLTSVMSFVMGRVVIPGVRRPFGRPTGQAGRRPCPLRLIWTGQGIVDREIIVPNLLYYSNFSYYCPSTWSRGGWQSEMAVHGSTSAPVWPFKFTMGGQSTPFWPLSGGREGLSGVSGGRAIRPTNNPGHGCRWG